MIPVVTSENGFFSCIENVLQQSLPDKTIVQFKEIESAIDFLRIEMPELVILNFSDNKIDAELLVNIIKGDTWLFSCGIIGISKTPEILRETETVKGTNLLALLEEARIEKQLGHVLSIVYCNRHMLFQRVIGADLGSNLSACFQLRNDPLEADVFINLICNYLYNINRIDVALKHQLMFVLHELVINAIEHGNCSISFKEKTDWLAKEGDITDLIEQKCREPQIARRKVFLEYHIHSDFTTFKITDEGNGFDWRAAQKQAFDLGEMEQHGRGIALARRMTRNLKFNEKGTCIQFELEHQQLIANATPALFHELEAVKFATGEIVFKQGDPSDFLYYVTQGSFEVFVDNATVSVLTPDDIFVGEMSFLLNNRRSATVIARTDSSLIRISKKEFVEGIKEKPHYSLLLARLLARRLERLNHQLGLQKAHI